MEGKLMKKRIGLFLMVFTALLVVVGCGASTNEPSPNETNQDGTEANTTDDGNKTIKIGALWPSAAIPPVQSKMEAAAEIAKELGVELINMDAQNDAQTQAEQAKNLITQKVDGVLIDLIDPQAIIPAVKELQEAGIPIITTTMPVSAEGEGYVTGHVGGDNYNGGLFAAELMDEALDGKGGKVVMVEGNPGVTVKARTDGFTDGIKEIGNIELLGAQSSPWDRQKAMDIMQDFLTKYPDIDGVFVHHDSMVPGVQQALTQAGKLDQVKIIGFGATIDGTKLIEEGVIYGSPIEDLWWESQEGVRLMVDFINEKDIPKEKLGEQRIIKKGDLDSYTSKNF